MRLRWLGLAGVLAQFSLFSELGVQLLHLRLQRSNLALIVRLGAVEFVLVRRLGGGKLLSVALGELLHVRLGRHFLAFELELEPPHAVVELLEDGAHLELLLHLLNLLDHLAVLCLLLRRHRVEQPRERGNSLGERPR